MNTIHSIHKAFVCLLFLLFAQLSIAQNYSQEHWDGKLFLKLKPNSNIELPPIEDKTKVLNYPYFNDLLHKFNTYKLFKPFAHLKSSILHDVYQIEFEDVERIETFFDALQKYDIVEYVEPIPIDRIFSEPDDPYLGHQWHLNKIKASTAWDVSTGSEDIVVAVIDDAIKTTHEDLKNIIWTNHLEIPNNGVDDDNNGFVDDFQGYDMADNDNNPNPPINSPYLRHGTHVTGIIASETNNGLGIASIGNGIEVLPIKASKDNTAPEKAGLKTSISHGWQGVSYAIMMNVDIINLSWGSKASSQTYQNLLTEAHNKGIIVVAAAGNNSNSDKVYPAAYEHVVAVAATNPNDSRLEISSYGDWVDVSAPGGNIISTSSTANNAYENNSGTSMASPLVAGLLGLMWSHDRSVLLEDLLNCLLSNTDPISTPSDNKPMGTGRINAAKAMQCLTPPICEVSSSPVCTSIEANSVNIVWEATSSVQYKVAYKISGISNLWTYKEVITPFVFLENLIPSTDYIIKVASICEESISEYSAITYFTTLSEAICNAPTDVTNDHIDSTTAVFSWYNEGNNNRYKVAHKLVSATSWIYSETDDSNIYLENLEPNHTYVLKVASICEELVSDYSPKVYFKTEEIPCHTPTQLEAKELSHIEAEVAWNNTTADRYRFAFKLQASVIWNYIEVASNNINLKNLSPEHTYMMKVASICGESLSDYTAPIFFTTPPPPCRIPVAPTVSELTARSMVFTWEGESQNTYRIAYKTKTSISWNYLLSETSNIHLKDLVPNSTYLLKVASVCGQGLSNYTEPIQVTTIQVECPIPINIKTYLVASQKVRVSWIVEDNDYIEGYIVRYRPQGVEVWKKEIVSTPIIYIGFLKANQIYELQVSTTCVGDEIGKIFFSETVFFETRNLHEPISANEDSLSKSKNNISHTFTTFKTFPNPSNGRYSVQFDQKTATDMILYVYDQSAKIVYSELWNVQIGNNRFEIDLSNQPKGRYFLQLTQPHGSTLFEQTILLY